MLNEVDGLLTRNRIFVDRTRDVGVISKEQAIAFGLSGPNLRGSGVDHDLRKKNPYLDYQNYDFDVPIGSVGDCYDRYLVRLEEMRPECPDFGAGARQTAGRSDQRRRWQEHPSAQAGRTDEDGGIDSPFHPGHGRDRRTCPARCTSARKIPKGELGFYINSRGGGVPHRLKIRSPSFVNLSIPVDLAAQPHDERRGVDPRQPGFRHGRMRPLKRRFLSTSSNHPKKYEKSPPLPRRLSLPSRCVPLPSALPPVTSSGNPKITEDPSIPS